jgi:hypothetical protein
VSDRLKITSCAALSSSQKNCGQHFLMIRLHSLVFSAALLLSPRTAPAAIDQPDYTLLNRIAACQSIPCIVASQPDVKRKTERTVFYARWLLLKPSDREASKGLLENIPTTDHEVMMLFTLPVWHPGATTSEKEMDRLYRIYSEWPRLLSVAVRRWPEFLPAYIRYGALAMHYMHSDYAEYERNVCRKNRAPFNSAFRTLSAEDQTRIRSSVFDPDRCEPIFASSADR